MVRLTEPQQGLILSLAKGGMKPEYIAPQVQRQFKGMFITPSDVAEFLAKHTGRMSQQRRDDIAKVKDQVLSHDEELKWARAILKERIMDADLSPHSLVELTGEYRKNILASQEVARLADNSGNVQFVLMYGEETVKQSTNPEDIQDAEFISHEDEEG